jgi:CRISPR-associated protein Cmr3
VHWLSIEATDVWMFRDSKPFSAGQNFVARSMFPPSPQTMQGILRSAYLETRGVDWRAYASGRERQDLYDDVGDASTLGQLRLHGPHLARSAANDSIERMLPAPRDLLWSAAKSAYQLMAPGKLQAVTDEPFNGWQPTLRPPGSEGFSELEGHWLSEEQFSAYLTGRASDITGAPTPAEHLFDFEERPGLGLSRERRTADTEAGLYYRARFVRPAAETRLLVGASLEMFQKAHTVRMGGEGRTGTITPVNYQPSSASTQRGDVRIVLLTPAWFDGGWGPASGDWSPWVGSGELVSFVAGRPTLLSGWNLAAGKPRPLRAFVPAGSVYTFRNAALTSRHFTQSPTGEADFEAIGFGVFAAGNWPAAT